jgi:hypothetical protein
VEKIVFLFFYLNIKVQFFERFLFSFVAAIQLSPFITHNNNLKVSAFNNRKILCLFLPKSHQNIIKIATLQKKKIFGL